MVGSWLNDISSNRDISLCLLFPFECGGEKKKTLLGVLKVQIYFSGCKSLMWDLFSYNKDKWK